MQVSAVADCRTAKRELHTVPAKENCFVLYLSQFFPPYTNPRGQRGNRQKEARQGEWKDRLGPFFCSPSQRSKLCQGRKKLYLDRRLKFGIVLELLQSLKQIIQIPETYR